jgi:sterol desaturase/sphingolipid hydroxylase (fatty acid hydroxylase superfamily)
MYISLFVFVGGILLSLIKLWVDVAQPEIPVDVPHNPMYTVAQILSYIILSDFIFYWYHRAQHAFPVFWVIHELHHADTELNVTSSLRTYFLERPLQFLCIQTPLIILINNIPALSFLHIDGSAALLLYYTMLAWLFVGHANIKFFEWNRVPLFVGPQVHRIHHSIEVYHQNKNFAQHFPFIDMIFGTFHAPLRGEYPKTGTPKMISDTPVFEVLCKPLKEWRRMVRSKILEI